MGKKKIEHIVFDGVRKQKTSIPFHKVNRSTSQPYGKQTRSGTREENLSTVNFRLREHKLSLESKEKK